MSIFRFASVLFLAAGIVGCGSSSSSTAPTGSNSSGGTTTTGSPVSIVNGASVLTTTAYNPNPISVSVGGTVTWTNNDRTTHTSSADGGGWNSGNIAPGASFSHTFPAAGSFPYHCAIHPGMVGVVNVQ